MIDRLRERAAPYIATSRQRFIVLITGVLSLSMVMVAIAFNLYRLSGVEQVDMSLPRYQNVRQQVVHDDQTPAFASSGSVNDSVVKDFIAQYDARTNKITPVQDFSNNALSDESLGLAATPPAQ